MNKPTLNGPPPSRRISRAGDVLISNKVLILATLLRRSASVVYRRELGLSPSEWRIVAIVGDQAPLSLSQLVELIGLDKGQMSRSVTALVNRRILARVLDETDSREIRIDLTPRGREVFETLMALALARNRELTSGLGKSELATLFEALDRLVVNAKTMLAESHLAG